jgi:hypothetical protein
MANSNNLATARACFAVTPDNTTKFARRVRALYVGGTGNITLLDAEGTVCLFTAVPAGTILPVECVRVNSTGTTATLLIGLV